MDFTDGAGNRICMAYCLFAIAMFAIPVGIIIDSVQSTLQESDTEAMLNIEHAMKGHTFKSNGKMSLANTLGHQSQTTIASTSVRD